MKDKLGIFLMNWRIRVVLPYLQGNVLDIGCGTNKLLETYRKIGEGRGIGIDVYPWEGVDQIVPNSYNLHFDNESFNTVCCIAALNHIPERENMLRDIYRILHPNGRLILTMIPPGISRIWHALRRPWDADQSERSMTSGEVFGFTARQINNLLKNNSFRLVKIKRFMLGLNTLYWAEKT